MPKIQDQVITLFAQLDTQLRAIQLKGGGSGNTPYADPEQFYAWGSRALNAIQGVFGKDSPHFVAFEKQMASVSNNHVWDRKLETFRGMFQGAKSDVDGGYLFDMQISFSGEIFGDLVATAKAALSEGQHTVAAVLACAALEDALKRYAQLKGLSVDGQAMEEVVNALKSKGLIGGAQKTLLGAMPKIRNHAMHAEWE
ncbi:MAG: hypothetical protein Q7J80_15020, partial [Anaerolineales bacterium]|nr:hypothetical protein [Anaerolineales bacterium]